MSNIAIISNSNFYGGGENFIENTLSNLKKWHNLFFLVKSKELYGRLLNSEQNAYLIKSYNLLSQVFEINKYLNKANIDLVIFNGGSIGYFSFVFDSAIKKIFYRHTTDEYYPNRKKLLLKFLTNLTYKNVDLTIHVSEYSLRQQGHGKAICIHNGIKVLDKVEYLKDDIFNVLYCGRLDKAKGICEIVRAFKCIPPTLSRLTIIGSGEMESWVKKNVAENIIFNGFQKEVSNYYERANALILMSEFENFPISIIEAMRYSLPIITTGAGGISEMVKHNYNGLIIKRNVQAISDAVMQLAQDSTLAKKLGDNSLKFCKSELNIDNKIFAINDIILKLLNDENRY